jgi:hypothetical protein
MDQGEAKLVSTPLGSVLHDLVRAALETQHVTTSDDTEYYLASLLRDFLHTDSERLSRALGMELFKVEELDSSRRFARLKDIADTSLFLSGIFLDHVESGLAATDYVFEIGSTAYLRLGHGERRHPLVAPFAETFKDLGRRFEQFVRVLAVMSDSELFSSNARVLGLYERWLRSGTARDAHRLVALGVIPGKSEPMKSH